MKQKNEKGFGYCLTFTRYNDKVLKADGKTDLFLSSAVYNADKPLKKK